MILLMLRSVLLAGLCVAALDAFAACVHGYLMSGATPEGVFRYVSSGWFGSDAAKLPGAAWWGLFFHILIAIGWTGLCYLIYPFAIKAQLNPIVFGLIYGALVWVGMNFVVLPLSNVPHFSIRWSRAWVMILIHLFVIGVPISLFCHRFYRQ